MAVQCCCCCSLRTGCVIIAVLSLIWAASYGVQTAASLVVEATTETNDVSPFYMLGIFIIKFTQGILLLCAIVMNKIELCYGYLVCNVIECIMDLLVAAFFFLAASAKTSKYPDDGESHSSRYNDAKAQAEVVAGTYYLAGALHLAWVAVAIYYFFVVLNYTYEVKEQLALRQGQMQAYPSAAAMQMGYAPNYNQYPSYTAQAGMYPEGQGSEHPSTQGMNPQQNSETPQ